MKLHLGCGDKYIPGFVNIDVQKSEAVDVVSDVMKLPYKENSIDLIYSCSMLEDFGKNVQRKNNLRLQDEVSMYVVHMSSGSSFITNFEPPRNSRYVLENRVTRGNGLEL